jgi:glycosyltransferase involved in cell wall biosynthesis
MKIVYITQYYPPHTGGLEYVARMQAESALRAGHDVSVVTFAVHGTSVGVTTERGVVVHRVSGVDFFEKRFGIPFRIGGSGLIKEMVRSVREADVVHFHDVFYTISLVGYVVAAWYKKPVMLTQHVGIVPHPRRFVVLAQRVVYALWGQLIFRASNTIITYQTMVTDFLQSRGIAKESIAQIHNGVSLERFKPISDSEKERRRRELGLPVNKKLVLFVGRMVPKKGHHILFGARDSAYDLVFIGPGDVPHEWHTTPGVHMLGERTPEELAYLYPVVDVFAAPSQGEMFTVVMQEALASGLPLVIADAPEYRAYQLDMNNITLCEPTSEAFSTALRRIVGDEQLRTAMGSYSRTLAETYFDWDKNVQVVLDLYREMYDTR